jgi:hypothetical protein
MGMTGLQEIPSLYPAAEKLPEPPSFDEELGDGATTLKGKIISDTVTRIAIMVFM